ncbi:MAG TPA: pentapeptide repeat-containing protein [Coleofasciculaceae cyanobacterium]
MYRPQDRIPEDKAPEVFTRAAQLYAQHNQSYSVQELMEAGTEAKIPPEFIQQAIEELQIQQSPTQSPVSTSGSKPAKALIALVLGLPLVMGIAVAGWLVSRNAAQGNNAPVATVQPIDSQQGIADFKCAGLTLEGKDLTGKTIRDCTNAKLTGANLSGNDLQGANFSKSDLSKANLSGANLQGADLAGANLADANLSGTNLEGANLSQTNLKGANLEGANLNGTDLAGANLEGAKQ